MPVSACNLFSMGPDVVRHKLSVLREHCEAEGTDYDGIHKTMLYAGTALMTGDHDGFLKEMAAYAELGIEEVQAMPWTPDPLAFVEGLAANVVAPLRDL